MEEIFTVDPYAFSCKEAKKKHCTHIFGRCIGEFCRIYLGEVASLDSCFTSTADFLQELAGPTVPPAAFKADNPNLFLEHCATNFPPPGDAS